ncbi:Lecithin retinol acyltransferase [Orenia metallireducens]|uniref:Lecithin retinol acyltransferase n=1 Tax=Orenia metallireducens TaxID=1413210 RepID=A0A285GTT2_9FIRM|nr:lecithin retinol acyltransferase family protein [Orenia metallireducens]SNY26868.1 Lecithin retinol acyltransferase [Orenia metallireducens]
MSFLEDLAYGIGEVIETCVYGVEEVATKGIDLVGETIETGIDIVEAKVKDGTLFNIPNPIIDENPTSKLFNIGRHERQVIHDKIREKSEILGELDTMLMSLEDTVSNLRKGSNPKNMVVELLIPEQSPSKGDHLAVWRGTYYHHGLYVGNGRVYHYNQGEIREDFLSTFRKWGKVRVIHSPKKYRNDEVVERAERRYGEDSYNVVFNNCEHFVVWCRCGD